MMSASGDDVIDIIKVLPGHAIQYAVNFFFSNLHDKINLLHKFPDR